MGPRFNLIIKGQMITLWVLLSTPAVVLDVEFIDTQSNSSVQFSCGYPNESNINPFAFTLQREWLNPNSVLYFNFGSCTRASDPKLDGRIFVQHDSNKQRINVTINDLQSNDTDLYICTFHYDHQSDFNTSVSEEKAFLYVRDFSFLPSEVKDCSSSDYKLLLFSLSAAAGLLFIISLVLAVCFLKSLTKFNKDNQEKVDV